MRTRERIRHATTLWVVLVSFSTLVACASQPAAQQQPTTQQRSGPNWSKYYDRTSDRPPRPLLIEALERFATEDRPGRLAVDAGCGAGTDTLFLLRQGIEVHAFDSDAGGIERLRSSAAEHALEGLHSEVAPFHQAAWPTGADLVFAGFSLPFAQPADFPAAWRQLTDSLATGGRFAGHLFGERDGWAPLGRGTFHTLAEVEALLAEDFEVEVLREVENDRPTAAGDVKHWHFFEIIASKR